MQEQLERAVITEILLAIRVEPGMGKKQHADRASHGLVINDENCCADYVFSDGTVLRTKGWSVYYLPKHSTYRVESRAPCGCWAVNFDLLGVGGRPELVQFRSGDPVLELFRQCVEAFRDPAGGRDLILRRNLYEILLRMRSEAEKGYVPGRESLLIRPAAEYVYRHFADPDLSVAGLAAACGISESYLRRLFRRQFGTSPKEEILRQRIRYAKTLLSSGQFPVREVSEMCGFREPCQFSREFARQTGLPPRAYRRERLRGDRGG